jgi:hypothetical protein
MSDTESIKSLTIDAIMQPLLWILHTVICFLAFLLALTAAIDVSKSARGKLEPPVGWYWRGAVPCACLVGALIGISTVAIRLHFSAWHFLWLDPLLGGLAFAAGFPLATISGSWLGYYPMRPKNPLPLVLS